MNALIVEDCPMHRLILTKALNSVGFNNIHMAVDGKDGLSAVKVVQFDVVITDWNLPRGDGLEIIKAVRERDTSIPIVMVTANVGSDRKQIALDAGATAFLTKPIDSPLLRKTLERYCTGLVAATSAGT